MSNSAHRSGMTKTELAVIVVVLYILMALILSAPSGPGGSRQIECLNNMASVSKAAAVLASFEDRGFPRLQNRLNDRLVSWQVMLLPYLERSNIYEQYEADSKVTERPPLRMFVCPRDKSKSADLPANSFVINGGMATEDVALENRADGVSFTNFGLTTDQIADGISTTLLLTENIQATTWDGAPTIPVPEDWDGTPSKLASTFLWHMTGKPTYGMRINRPKGLRLEKIPLQLSMARPSSHHPGGVVMAFCDGHTDFISEDIDYRVYIQLMTSDHANSSLQTATNMPQGFKTYKLRDDDLWK